MQQHGILTTKKRMGEKVTTMTTSNNNNKDKKNKKLNNKATATGSLTMVTGGCRGASSTWRHTNQAVVTATSDTHTSISQQQRGRRHTNQPAATTMMIQHDSDDGSDGDTTINWQQRRCSDNGYNTTKHKSTGSKVNDTTINWHWRQAMTDMATLTTQQSTSSDDGGDTTIKRQWCWRSNQPAATSMTQQSNGIDENDDGHLKNTTINQQRHNNQPTATMTQQWTSSNHGKGIHWQRPWHSTATSGCVFLVYFVFSI
jgi:hypothetical protein